MAGLAALLKEVKTRGLHAVVYSGYTVEVLARGQEVAVRNAGPVKSSVAVVLLHVSPSHGSRVVLGLSTFDGLKRGHERVEFAPVAIIELGLDTDCVPPDAQAIKATVIKHIDIWHYFNHA